MGEPTFGERALKCASPDALLDLEGAEGRTECFDAIDVVMAGLAVRTARGDRVLRMSRTNRGDRLELIGIPESLRATLYEAFQLESQQARGAWFLPETVDIKANLVSYGAVFREFPRYAHTLAAEERGTVALAGNPDAMVVWSALEPLFGLLWRPIMFRAEKSGLLTQEEFQAAWGETTGALTSLGLSLENELAPFAWGGGWARFGVEQQLAAKRALLNAIAEQMDKNVVRRYRAATTVKLVAQYYAKAKKGRAKRRQVITKEYARPLAAFFAGDWLGFVGYLGEQPHDEERVVTALPETKLIVSGKSKAAELAEKKGLPVEEVERILGAYWGGTGADSPVVERTKVLAEHWKAFDVIHARQAPGMPPLWGLVQEGGWGMSESTHDSPYQHELYRRLLAPELVASIERLWATTVLLKWPDRVVTEPYPHIAMAEAFGPALKFWHGCALTAWFVCEGPYSRTDIPGLAHYLRRELVALEDIGCPVHSQLFADLNAVRLGPEETIYSEPSQHEFSFGLSFEVKVSRGSRRSGFELLREVVTRHRRWWAERYFDAYLRAIWEVELKATGRQLHLMTEEKGKPPTLKQFAKYVVAPARHWFGGDVSLVYAALGQKFPGDGVKHAARVPRDRNHFVNAVFEALGGYPFVRRTMVESEDEAQRQAEQQSRHYDLRRLAAESLPYLQLEEVLGRSPTLKEFGAKFEEPSKALADDVDAAWQVYCKAIERALEDCSAADRRSAPALPGVSSTLAVVRRPSMRRRRTPFLVTSAAFQASCLLFTTPASLATAPSRKPHDYRCSLCTAGRKGNLSRRATMARRQARVAKFQRGCLFGPP
ncbi:MAG TPA: hypothetical protein VFS43_21180 [Polyangiaceae bacterium]|nr:hypothetical protein [Polyangiaceae bacterium]